MDKLEVIKACLTLISYVRLNDGTGADFVIDTPEVTVHFTYDFTLELKNQEENTND